MPRRLPRLPSLVGRKIYKTGQTRGADDDEIFQNRVGRNSTVLIPLPLWEQCSQPDDGSAGYENGAIVPIPPTWYFAQRDPTEALRALGLELGQNALLFYQTRAEWLENDPTPLGMTPATSRIAPLGGQYVARVPATTARDGGSTVKRGFTTTASKGAGIRVYEYASTPTLAATRAQLEALFWSCEDAETAMTAEGMTAADVATRRSAVTELAGESGLLDPEALLQGRLINEGGSTVCPLCLAPMAADAFVTRIAQAEGRESPALTVTQASLFHVQELRPGTLMHRPYNLGWGHHHCNVVAKDSGIQPTLDWLRTVLDRNDQLKARLAQKGLD